MVDNTEFPAGMTFDYISDSFTAVAVWKDAWGGLQSWINAAEDGAGPVPAGGYITGTGKEKTMNAANDKFCICGITGTISLSQGTDQLTHLS